MLTVSGGLGKTQTKPCDTYAGLGLTPKDVALRPHRTPKPEKPSTGLSRGPDLSKGGVVL